MILRLHTFLAGCLALLLAALLAFAPVGAKPASGGYQLFEPVASGHQADIQLAALGNFDYFAKIAPECCNATKSAVSYGVSVGRNANQDYHVWRHVEDEFGMSRQRVQDAVVADLPPVADLSDGLNIRFVNVDGVRLQYNAFKLPDGTVNIGRIHETN